MTAATIESKRSSVADLYVSAYLGTYQTRALKYETHTLSILQTAEPHALKAHETHALAEQGEQALRIMYACICTQTHTHTHAYTHTHTHRHTRTHT